MRTTSAIGAVTWLFLNVSTVWAQNCSSSDAQVGDLCSTNSPTPVNGCSGVGTCQETPEGLLSCTAFAPQPCDRISGCYCDNDQCMGTTTPTPTIAEGQDCAADLEYCAQDDDCQIADEICCPYKKVCEIQEPGTNPAACGDPHMTGFLGQKFDFTGEDGGHYALIRDGEVIHVNMRVTSPIPDFPVITYITGLSVLATDSKGIQHTIVIEAKDPHNIESSCPSGVYPCLAEGSLRVVLDGEEALLAPGSVTLGNGVSVSAVNIPGECRSFGFEKYWERKTREYASASRRLNEKQRMGEWVLGDPTITNMEECTVYVANAELQAGGLFLHQSEHASFQIVTPKATIRLSHGRLHQIAMRDPTDQFDLPEHLAWQMNMGLDDNIVSHTATGILGETFVPTLDTDGNHIMFGMESIRGSPEDYRVEGALGVEFAQDRA